MKSEMACSSLQMSASPTRYENLGFLVSSLVLLSRADAFGSNANSLPQPYSREFGLSVLVSPVVPDLKSLK